MLLLESVKYQKHRYDWSVLKPGIQEIFKEEAVMNIPMTRVLGRSGIEVQWEWACWPIAGITRAPMTLGGDIFG